MATRRSHPGTPSPLQSEFLSALSWEESFLSSHGEAPMCTVNMVPHLGRGPGVKEGWRQGKGQLKMDRVYLYE